MRPISNGAAAASIVVPPGTVVESNGSTVLTRVGDNYFLHPVGDSNGVQLSAFGAPVVAGQFGAFAPIAAEATAGGGYAVAWKAAGADQYTVLNADSSGVFQSHAFFVVSGGSYALQSIELTFQQDLNSDGTVGPIQVTVDAVGSAHLVQLADTYFLSDGSGVLGPQLKYQGAAVTAGSSGGWEPVGAEAVSGGYQVVWQYGSTDLYTIWSGLDGNGNFAGSGLTVGGGRYALQAAESTFGQDFNHDGQVGPTQVPIEAVGTARLVQLADSYFLYGSSGAPGLQLKYYGTAVTAGSSGGWTPVGAAVSGGGYQVVWQYGSTDLYTIWTGVDSAGNFAGNGLTVGGGRYALQAAESTFGQDFNHDGQVGPTQVPIEAVGTARLVQLADSYFLYDGSGAPGPQLKYYGTAVAAGSSGAWAPVGAAVSGGGYQVVWQYGSTGPYTIWTGVDGAGNFAGSGLTVGGGSYALQAAESTFDQDFNRDGQVGPTQVPIEAVGTARLVQLADGYFLYGSSGAPGPQLKLHGTAVTAGSSGGWAPVGAEAASGGGYQVVWQYGNQFTLWTGVDGAGNFAGSGLTVGGGSYALQAAESTFGQDFNHDGQVGPTQVTIEAAGTARLVQLADSYFLYGSSGAPGPQLKLHGTAVTAGSSGGWAPVGAEAASGGGYQVVWQYGSTGPYTLWTGIDGTGNFAGSGLTVGRYSYALESAESTFGQDLNHDGTIGISTIVIESAGSTSLVMTADTYYLRQANSQSGLQLTYGGAAVTMGMFGAWTPIGVEQTASGYQVAWRGASGSDQYQLWDVNSSGAFRSNYAGVMASSHWIMRTVETTLRQDLNNDGLTGLPTSPYDIVISYSGDPGYQIFFDAAAARWEQVITADVPDVINPGYGYIDDLLISASVTLIDGVGGILGSAGPDYIRTSSGLPTHGNMQFDSADLAGMAANGTLYYVVLHEVGHILGVGSLWSYMGLKSGSQYTGHYALDAYRQLSGNGAASYVPLETSGGSGTAGVHWSEAVFGNELMTGYIGGTPAPLSSLTIAGLRDLGYSVNAGQAEPYVMPGHLTAGDGSAGSSDVPAVTTSTGLLTTDMAFIDDGIDRA